MTDVHELGELIARLERAHRELLQMADTGSRTLPEYRRLMGKAEDVSLALPYAREHLVAAAEKVARDG